MPEVKWPWLDATISSQLSISLEVFSVDVIEELRCPLGQADFIRLNPDKAQKQENI